MERQNKTCWCTRKTKKTSLLLQYNKQDSLLVLSWNSAKAAPGGPPPTEAQESKMEAVVAMFTQLEQITAALEKAV